MSVSGTPAPVSLRPFTPDDYPLVVDLYNRCFPEYQGTVADWQFNDGERPEHIRWKRFVAEDGEGVAVGWASYNQHVDMYHPRKFNLDICVAPEKQRQGIGAVLHDHLLCELAPFDPVLVRGNVREDYSHSVQFLTQRGYHEEMRGWESRLQMADYDPTPFLHRIDQVTSQGIVIKSLSELAADPDRDRKLYEMDWTIVLDMPSPDTLTKPTFEHFEKKMLNNPDLLPEAWFVALDGDNYIGESCLWRSEGNPYLHVGATGVLPEYRRRGIAFALKLHATGYAKRAGVQEIRTWNAQSNRAMLSINEALGFVKQPAWIAYAKTLKAENE